MLSSIHSGSADLQPGGGGGYLFVLIKEEVR